MSEPERIVRAAVRVQGGVWSLPRPLRHHHVLHHYQEVFRKVAPGRSREQGFLTSEGRFVERIEAVDVARAAGQLAPEFQGKRLYSEDVW